VGSNPTPSAWGELTCATGAWSTAHVRERVQRSASVERSEADGARERTPTPPAAVLHLQRSAGNAATARLLQRAPHHTQYAPAAGHAIAPQFRTNHIRTDERHAIDQHANRGTLTVTNTFVDMSNEDAADEIRHYLHALPAHQDISSWNNIDFVTYSAYWCYETTLLDNNTGLYEVCKVYATLRVQAWWDQGRGVFVMGHMHGIAARDRASETTSQIQMV
jgi:hypothetical protein